MTLNVIDSSITTGYFCRLPTISHWKKIVSTWCSVSGSEFKFTLTTKSIKFQSRECSIVLFLIQNPKIRKENLDGLWEIHVVDGLLGAEHGRGRVVVDLGILP